MNDSQYTLLPKPGDTVTNLQLEAVRYLFEASDTLYRILRCKDENNNGKIVVGNFGDALVTGCSFLVKGKWIKHVKYGMQIRAETVVPLTPVTTEGICKYLCSEHFSGIGPSTAKNIVDRFGTATLDVIRDTPSRLKEVPGIGDSKAEQIRKSWQKYQELNQLFIQFYQHGLTQHQCYKIYQNYGSNSLSILEIGRAHV